MLQDNKSNTVINNIQPFGSEQFGPAETIHWAVGLLRRQYLVVLFTTLIVIGVGIIYLRIAAPIYTAQASLVVDLHRSPMVQQEGIYSNDPIEIDSQIQIIRSESIASAVIKKLQLMNDPEFRSAGGIISRLIEHYSGPTAESPSELNLIEATVGTFEDHLVVEQGGGRVITIKFSSQSRERAALIANATANAYITDQLDAKYEANRVASGWLQDRQRQLREQADAAQRAVESFKKQNMIADDGTRIDDQQLNELNSRLTTARAQTSDILARLNRLQALIRLGPSDPNINAAISDTNSQIMMNLRQQYLELARRESEWSVRYGHDHLAVVNLRNRMQEIRQSIFDELRRSADAAKIDYEISKQRQEDIKKQLETSTANQITSQLRGLETAATTYRDLYKTFLQQYMGTTQDASFPISQARLVSPASPLLVLTKPKPGLILALSIVGGFGLGLGLAILRDMMDRVFRTARQLEAALKLPCIAVVPLLKVRPTKRPLHRVMPRANGNDQITMAFDSNVFWTVVDSPLSSFAEAIRSIKLAIDLNMAPGPCKVVGFTSTLPNEGKSTLAAALAQLVAQARARVLLVDCDLRNPSLSRILAPEAAVGIVNVLAGESSAENAILKEPKAKMAILPAGKRIPRFLSSEILSGEPMSKLFEALRKNYDYIIVDLPPLAPIVDVRASTHLVDSIVMTVEWGHTKIDAVEQALESASVVYDRLIGAVLNKTDMDFIRYYDSGGRYDYNKHYARYGYTE